MKILGFFVLIINLLVLGILTWFGNLRLDEFRNYHYAIAQESVSGVADSTARFVEEKFRLVGLFAQNEVDTIRRLAADPENEALHAQLQDRISAYFPDHFAFTLSDTQGEPLFEDFDGLIGETCKNDLIQFATAHPVVPRIHPNAEAYHFDIMSHFGDAEGVLFISFHADILGNALRAAQNSGHQLILALEQSPQLIEVTAEGARNKLDRLDFRLSDEEKSRLLRQANVAGTAWTAMDFQQPGLISAFKQRLIYVSSAVYALFFLASTLFIYFVYQAERRRQQAEQVQDEFLSTVSHELRTPLTAIRGALGLIAHDHDNQLSPQSKNLTALAISNTDNLVELVNDLLDIRRLEFTHTRMEMHAADLVKIVARSIELNREFGNQFGVDYRLHTSHEVISVRCNEQGIHQVMTNLLSNAAKYGAHENTVDVTLDIIDHQAWVKVSDHGEGIPQSFRPRIFEKFAQADSGNQRGSKGTGLGLSIAKHIIDIHKGTIGFDTQSGKGTTFYFTLDIVGRSETH